MLYHAGIRTVTVRLSTTKFAHYINKVVLAILEPLFRVFCWFHWGFTNPSRDLFLSDGVHDNRAGQYILYRSYRGAILSALKFPQVSRACCSNVYGLTLTSLRYFRSLGY